MKSLGCAERHAVKDFYNSFLFSIFTLLQDQDKAEHYYPLLVSMCFYKGKSMKAIILAGGNGTRLYPITQVITKQLMHIYDKPMIYYPLSLLMLAGIKDILIITRQQDLTMFQALLSDGSQFGINIQYKIQEQPKGLPEAFTIGENFIGDDNVTLILGDNLFYGDISWYKKAIEQQIARGKAGGGQIFGYYVSDPRAYGVVELDETNHKILSLEEKPQNPKSRLAIPGLYIFDSTVVERSKNLTPSPRGETEITDLMNSYHQEGLLSAQRISRGVAWLDTGTPKSLIEASSYIAAIEERQSLKVACLEEIAFRMNFINDAKLRETVSNLPNCSYKDYIVDLFPKVFR